MKGRRTAPEFALIPEFMNTQLARQPEAHKLDNVSQPHLRQSKDTRARIRILATSDLHMNLTGYDYYADRADTQVGFTRTATLIRAARHEARQDDALVMLFDNCDALQGTPFGQWAASADHIAHPLPQAFAALGYDAVGLGNHDFGFGIAFLEQIADQSPYPILCSNLRYNTPNNPWQPYAILPRTIRLDGAELPISIGVLSVLPPQTAQWEAHKLRGKAEVADILTSARETAAELRRNGCDLVVALAHTGLGSSAARAGLENAVIPLAELGDIDAIIAGHTHLTLPGPAHAGLDHVDHVNGMVHGKPVMMPGWAGSHLGIIDLHLARDDAQKWRVADKQTELRAIRPEPDGPAVAEDAEVSGLFAAGHAATKAQAAQPVGRVSQPMHSYFTYCAPDRGLTLLAMAQAAALRPLLGDTQYADLPVLSAAAPAKFGGRAGPRYYTDVPAGDITMRHVADLHIFPNELRAVVANGADVLDWLEMSAGLFNQLAPGGAQYLTDPHRTGHNFDVLYGVSCQIDLSGPALFDADGRVVDPVNSRIRNATFDGRPITPDQTFVVALNNYRANGGGNFPIAREAHLIPLPSLHVQDILRDYLMGHLAPDPLEQADRPFSFASSDSTTAVLKTGPIARYYMGELANYQPRDLGLDDDGFLQIQLTL